MASKRYPVAPKVKAATTGAGLGGIVSGIIIWALGYYVFKDPSNPPQIIQAEIYAAVPAVVAGLPAFILGFRAPHQARPSESPASRQSTPPTPAGPVPPAPPQSG